ncbi:hypothetical protein [Chryseobacterium timonianum]|uniref:hypothetical protein n=2 Tax=Chryseobacterium TaxID=59732 RepID=UPI00083A1F27|nr:hypothetical protein [Chryseobacterium timonianum]
MESIRIEIKDITNLDSLSREYDLSKEELIAFHNQHCALHEIIPGNLPKYLKYIYIPADKESKRKEKSLLISQIALPDTPEESTYGILITTALQETRIHYLVDIQRKEKMAVSVVRKKIYINDQEIELMVEKLIETAGEALYPLQISLKKDGRPEAILNRNEIKNRWEREYYPKLHQYYEGEVADEMIEKLNRFYENMSGSTEVLHQNLFYAIYFMPLYMLYPDYQKEEILTFYFPSLDEIITYTTIFSLQKTLTDHDKILIHIKGEQINTPIATDLNKGTLDLLYQLDRETKSISSIVGKLSAFHQNKEIDIAIEIYEQKSYI